MDGIEMLSIQRVTGEGKQEIEDPVARELPLTITLNDREIVTLLCSPLDLKYLAIGFLSSAGLIKSKHEVKKVTVDESRGVVNIETKPGKEQINQLLSKRVVTSGCGQGALFHDFSDTSVPANMESQLKISATEVCTLIKQFLRHSQIYLATGGVHSAALCDTRDILVSAEDIGRHNAIDKVFGRCLMDEIPTDGRIIITSGRLSSEIVLKMARRNIPILVSKSAPTNLGVGLARDLEITLIGFVRGKRMNIYSAGWRITANGE